MKRTYKYRLYPNPRQETGLARTLETCRRIYNDALTQRRWYYAERGKGLSLYDQQRELKEARDDDPELQYVPSHVCQDVLRRLDKAFISFFRRLSRGQKPGYPRYKGRDRYDSFTYPDPDQGSGYRLFVNPEKPKRSKLRLSGIGAVKIRYHRGIPEHARIKTCTVRRRCGRWYACLSLGLPDVPQKEVFDRPVGLDLGIISVAASSDGETIPNPRHLQGAEARLKLEQRRLSGKRRGSSNRRRQRRRVAEAHLKVADRRGDFLHKVSHRLVDSYDLIFVEDLRVNNMLKNHYLAKAIADASWSTLISMLAYKAEDAGGLVVKVDPRGTSQECSGCGARVPKSLAVRVHRCPGCGLELDRDVNAARNVRRAGAALIARGEDVRPRVFRDVEADLCEAGTPAL